MLKAEQFHGIKYITSTPINAADGEKYPAIIFLHGAGTRGDDVENVKANPFYQHSTHYIERCVTFAPLCNRDTWFDMFEELQEFCEYVSQCKNVDENRVYLMGASMGGYATWQMAMSKPELFAAIVPICGGGMYWNAMRLKNVPVWAFHGDADDCVFVEESIKMVDSVNAIGGNAKITLYKNTGHDAWTPTYENEAVFDWLFSYVKNGEGSTYTNFNDAQIYG